MKGLVRDGTKFIEQAMASLSDGSKIRHSFDQNKWRK